MTLISFSFQQWLSIKKNFVTWKTLSKGFLEAFPMSQLGRSAPGHLVIRERDVAEMLHCTEHVPSLIKPLNIYIKQRTFWPKCQDHSQNTDLKSLPVPMKRTDYGGWGRNRISFKNLSHYSWVSGSGIRKQSYWEYTEKIKQQNLLMDSVKRDSKITPNFLI